jgi:hypothetical protein
MSPTCTLARHGIKCIRRVRTNELVIECIESVTAYTRNLVLVQVCKRHPLQTYTYSDPNSWLASTYSSTRVVNNYLPNN